MTDDSILVEAECLDETKCLNGAECLDETESLNETVCLNETMCLDEMKCLNGTECLDETERLNETVCLNETMYLDEMKRPAQKLRDSLLLRRLVLGKTAQVSEMVWMDGLKGLMMTLVCLPCSEFFVSQDAPTYHPYSW